MSDRAEGWYYCRDRYGDRLVLFWSSEMGWITSRNYSLDCGYCKKISRVEQRIPEPEEDWVTVPRVPTDEMRAAQRASIMDIQGGYDSYADPWEAMIEAAPKP